jgi:NCAIR mutase (PurE)-related protein
MTTTQAGRLLDQFRAGKIPREKVLAAFQAAPVADLGFAQVDTHRALRKNFPEVIFGAGKTCDQVIKIAAKLRSGRTTRSRSCVISRSVAASFRFPNFETPSQPLPGSAPPSRAGFGK